MMEKQGQPQFIYPIPFQDFLNFRNKQREGYASDFNIKQMSKLRKLKKLLEMTEEKICNRIKLFKKVSADIQKKKQKQNEQHSRAQNNKRRVVPEEPIGNQQAQSYMRSTKSSASLQRIRQISQLQRVETGEKKAGVYLEEKHHHVKEIKMWKQKNRFIVEQRRLKQMREKVQSANAIRSNRHKAKETKIQWEQERLEEARKMKEQKFREEVERYDELQSNLTRLQREERDALIMWKRAMELP